MFRFFRDICHLVRGHNELGEQLDTDSVLNAENERYGRFARGNVSIQEGAFLPIAEMDRKREILARHGFPIR